MKHIIEVENSIKTRAERNWTEYVLGSSTGDSLFPARFTLGACPNSEFKKDIAGHINLFAGLNSWATIHGLSIEGRDASIFGTIYVVPTHVTVPSWEHALQFVDKKRRDSWDLCRHRRQQLIEQFDDVELTEGWILSALRDYSPVDFDLLVRTAKWVADNETEGLTPRQVPIEGVHAKWLDVKTNMDFVKLLAKKDDLGLLDRPHGFFARFLDPAHAATSEPQWTGFMERDNTALPYEIKMIVICENMDNVVAFPQVIPGGLAIFGQGHAVSSLPDAIPWIKEIKDVYYWGDIDLDGYKILSSLRNKLPWVSSLCMDAETADRYRKYGTSYSRFGTAISLGETDSLKGNLAADEYSALRSINQSTSSVRRIEQERIGWDYVLDCINLLQSNDS